MSKLFDQLREAARMRAAASSSSPEKTGLLSQALKRAEAERVRVRQGDATPQDADTAAAQLAAERESAEQQAILDREAILERARGDQLAAQDADRRAEADRNAAEAERARAKAEEHAAAQAKKRAEAQARALEAANAKLEAAERALHAAEERARHESQIRAMQLAADEARTAELQASASMRKLAPQLERGRGIAARRGAIAAVVGISAVLIVWQLGHRPEQAAVPAPARQQQAWPGMKLDYQLDLTRKGGAARSSLPDPAPSK